mmetsp:Transcript_26438/g.84660  ORF Transcript_26438/g.84660 Transcript_26438/m.84660 type:complete len:98 (-) Transcript_26438:553-846(-)
MPLTRRRRRRRRFQLYTLRRLGRGPAAMLEGDLRCPVFKKGEGGRGGGTMPQPTSQGVLVTVFWVCLGGALFRLSTPTLKKDARIPTKTEKWWGGEK